MKYFVKDWYEDSDKAYKIMKEYDTHYKSIEYKLSSNVKNVLRDRHDTHIINTSFIENNYIMELEEHTWGKANIIFCNATVKHSDNIKDDYWLYDEIYLVSDKIEIHISFGKSDTIIVCDDAYISIEDKDYFKNLYEREDFKIELADTDKEDIANTVINKEHICGNVMLKPWELLIFSFIQIYSHINYYKYNNIQDKLINHYYNLSPEEKENMYRHLFSELEEKLIKSINILDKHKNIIKSQELENVIDKFLEIYNKKDTPIETKNQLYLNLDKQIPLCDLNNIYIRILECINANLTK